MVLLPSGLWGDDSGGIYPNVGAPLFGTTSPAFNTLELPRRGRLLGTDFEFPKFSVYCAGVAVPARLMPGWGVVPRGGTEPTRVRYNKPKHSKSLALGERVTTTKITLRFSFPSLEALMVSERTSKMLTPFTKNSFRYSSSHIGIETMSSFSSWNVDVAASINLTKHILNNHAYPWFLFHNSFTHLLLSQQSPRISGTAAKQARLIGSSGLRRY